MAVARRSIPRPSAHVPGCICTLCALHLQLPLHDAPHMRRICRHTLPHCAFLSMVGDGQLRRRDRRLRWCAVMTVATARAASTCIVVRLCGAFLAMTCFMVDSMCYDRITAGSRHCLPGWQWRNVWSMYQRRPSRLACRRRHWGSGIKRLQVLK